MRETMFRRMLGRGMAAGLAAALAASPALAQEADHQHHFRAGMPTAGEDGAATPLYDNLGTLHHKVTAGSAAAQQYFDQGLRLTYAFNHEEAIASYTQATREDSTCAMCWWGMAYALGPNINAPMDTAAYRPAYDAIQRALKLSSKATGYERDLIQAMAKRYPAEPVADRAPLDSAYATAMKDVAKKYPDDPEAQTLYGESLMNLSPWNYWEGRGTKARPGTQEVVTTLERTLKKYPSTSWRPRPRRAGPCPAPTRWRSRSPVRGTWSTCRRTSTCGWVTTTGW
jgi:ABC-type amino acid transport substrate-binding protein